MGQRQLENLVIRFTDEVVHSIKADAKTFDKVAKHFNPRQITKLSLLLDFI